MKGEDALEARVMRLHFLPSNLELDWRSVKHQRMMLLRLFTVVILLLSVSVSAAQRGISVTLRQSESVNAPVLEERELYQESYALVIGIDDYDNGWPRLSNAVRDAEEIAEALEQKGFEVELHRNLDSNELPQVFKRFFILKGENPEARLFVWFAGHGATVDGEGYLIPANAPVITQSTEFKFSSVALRDFGTFMRQSASKHVYAVFDACFAGTVFTAQRAMPPAAITRATTLPVRQFLTSGDADQTVSDDGQFRELFVRAILGEEPADANGDGYLTASEIGMYLGDRVTNLTESAQTPRYGKLRDKDFDRGDFVFVIDPSLKPVGSTNPEAELVFWDSVKDTGDSDMLLAYLSEYPSGRFTNLARIKLKRFSERLQSGLVKLSLEAIQERFLTLSASAIREFPSEEAEILLALPAGQKLTGIGKTQGPSPWIYVAVEGIPFGYIALDDLDAPSQSSWGNEEAERPLGEGDPSSMNERRQLRKSGDLDLRLSTALDEVIADQGARTPFIDESPLEGSVRSDPPTSVGATGNSAPDSVEAAASPNEPNVSEDELSSELDSVPVSNDSSSVNDFELEIAEVPGDSVASESDQNQESAAIDASDDPIRNKSTPAAEQKVDTDPSDEPMLEDSESQDTIPSTSSDGENEPFISSDDEAISLLASRGPESNSVQEMTVSSEASETSEASEQPSVAYSEFVRRYINAAIKGNVGAQATLGYFYEIGEHVEADVRESIRWYEKAASNGHLQATLRLAELEIATGNGQEGVSWYEKAAIQGDMDAQAMLGYFYQTGEHVTADLSVAIKWYLAAADQDHIAAQNNLGRLYQMGEGVAKDLDQAIYWYERAAKNGSDAAARNLQKLLP